MPSPAIPFLLLSCILFYGAFSRLTHGIYTPQFYAYQIDRQPDDGSSTALVVPVMDMILGTMMVLPYPRARIAAAAAFVVFQGIGLVMRVKEGKDVLGDVGLLVVGLVVAVLGGRR
jgi:hypothetical protein